MSKESAYFEIRNLSGKHDTKTLKRSLDSFRGVLSVSVNPEKNSLAVDYDSTGVSSHQLRRHLEELGYQVVSTQTDEHKM
ncbi:MAG TPA: heavy-metal-associated domain-containing protein [Clostridiales bacterium]|jgi:copper chaperone CopZ|nr:heavy-metal-associated domain-containing protein [Clostridiales bacterium]